MFAQLDGPVQQGGVAQSDVAVGQIGNPSLQQRGFTIEQRSELARATAADGEDGWRDLGRGGKKPLTRAGRVGLLTAFPFTFRPSHMSIEIKIRKNEPVDRAIRRMKKKLDRENIIKGVRAKRYYEKPCEKRRRKEKVQAFTQMLRRRYES
ncbi:MAG TPA: 30S ribosomal protein S21 [Opitutus sp.]|nr:30S ribosomal protein S21 [Opitutus sp.]